MLLRWDGLDDPFFPRSGVKFVVELFYGSNHQSAPGIADDTSTGQRGALYANAGVPVTPDDFLNVAVRGGAIHNERTDSSTPSSWAAFFNLSGLRTDQLDGRYLARARRLLPRTGRLPLIGRGIFAGGSLEAGNMWQQRNDVSAGDLIKAGSVFLAADTLLGPFYFAYGRATGGAVELLPLPWPPLTPRI